MTIYQMKLRGACIYRCPKREMAFLDRFSRWGYASRVKSMGYSGKKSNRYRES